MISTVIFDLFGTLVDNFPGWRFHACLTAMAEALGVDNAAFISTWTSRTMRDQRMVGASPDLATHIAFIGRLSGGQPAPEQVLAAEQLRVEYTRANLAPRACAVQVLEQLKSQHYRLGLISNCTWEVPDLWVQTPLAPLIAHPVFSCTVGMKKPNPAIFYLACERLNVEPEDCLYIGDGESNELIGASRVGMNAVHICIPEERETIMQRAGIRQWPGLRIESLLEVFDYLGVNVAVN